MKKLICLLLALWVFCLAALAETEEVNLDDMRTIGDLFAYERIDTAAYEEWYVYAFELDGSIYRAVAASTPELLSAILQLNPQEEDYEARLQTLTAPLEIAYIENLTEGMPSGEELEALVGQTGRELFEDGWVTWAWNLETMEFNMVKGCYLYLVRFDGGVEDLNGFEEEDLNLMTVASVICEGVGEPTALEIEP